MPQHKSAEKRVKQNERRRLRNKQKRTQMKSAIKKVRTATDKEVAQAELKNTVSILDRMAVKRIIHPNRAANLKAQLTRKVNAMS